ncbi:MAG TPA: hypothetical protein DEB06_02980 [Phycisphaerales bacterium]|nr:hypothetical protein [Phycisphaerales bacterium]
MGYAAAGLAPSAEAPARPYRGVAMPRSVILQHTEPDGSSHLDWLIAPDDAPAHPDQRDLLHFRLALLPGVLALGSTTVATSGPLHRRHYLQHEGPVPGGRGTVRRIAEGRVDVDARAADHWILHASFSDGSFTLEARRDPEQGDRWVLRRTR